MKMLIESSDARRELKRSINGLDIGDFVKSHIPGSIAHEIETTFEAEYGDVRKDQKKSAIFIDLGIYGIALASYFIGSHFMTSAIGESETPFDLFTNFKNYIGVAGLVGGAFLRTVPYKMLKLGNMNMFDMKAKEATYVEGDDESFFVRTPK
jgi:hypothetical protein